MMTEREAFVAWLETLEPRLPTTHDVEVAWRAWQGRAARFEPALRQAFPHFQDGSEITPEAILEIGAEYQNMVVSWSPSIDEIEFSDSNGMVGKITYDPGEDDVGVQAGWSLEPAHVLTSEG